MKKAAAVLCIGGLALILFGCGSGGAIKGTFSGTIKKNGSSSGASLAITNGYFYVKRLDDGAISAPGLFQ